MCHEAEHGVGLIEDEEVSFVDLLEKLSVDEEGVGRKENN